MMGIQLAVATLTNLKTRMERGRFLLDREINSENLLELIELVASLDDTIKYYDTQRLLALKQKGNDASRLPSDLVKQLNSLFKQFNDKLNLCLDNIHESSLSSSSESSSDTDDNDNETPVALTVAELRTRMLTEFTDTVDRLRQLNPAFDILTQLDTHKASYINADINLIEFKDNCTAALTAALRSDLAEQSILIKGLYLLLNIVAGLASAGILPAYSYATKRTWAFFSVPETDAVTILDSVQYKVDNMLGGYER